MSLIVTCALLLMASLALPAQADTITVHNRVWGPYYLNGATVEGPFVMTVQIQGEAISDGTTGTQLAQWTCTVEAPGAVQTMVKCGQQNGSFVRNGNAGPITSAQVVTGSFNPIFCYSGEAIYAGTSQRALYGDCVPITLNTGI